jgi:hypothetical protein
LRGTADPNAASIRHSIFQFAVSIFHFSFIVLGVILLVK